MFSKHFIKTGEISIEAGRHFREAFELRQRCDYREFVEITKEQAMEVIDNAKAFIDEAERWRSGIRGNDKGGREW